MYIEIGLSTLPPTLRLEDAEEFPWLQGGRQCRHQHHGQSRCHSCASTDPPRGDDWEARLDEMLAAAAAHGWIAADGAVRAHVEWRPPAEAAGTDPA